MPAALGDQKQCCRCGETKHVSEFRKRSKHKDGLEYYCKICAKLRDDGRREYMREQDRKSYYKNHEKRLARGYRDRGVKVPEKLIPYLHVPKEKVDQQEVYQNERDRLKQYKRDHKDIMRISWNRYYYSDLEKNRIRAKERQAKHREKPGIQEYYREAAKNWYYNNKEWAMIRRGKWRKTISGRLSVIKTNNKRREMNNDVIQNLSEKDLEFLLVLQNNECAKCEELFTNKKKYTIDHILPLSKGGNLTLDNVQLLCQSCNSSKSNKHILYRPNINFYCLSFI